MLIWQIAASETSHAKLQFIEREQLFIGLLKARSYLNPESPLKIGVNSSDLATIRDELDLIGSVFTRCGVDQTALRRKVRSLVGDGTNQPADSIVHRSEVCKRLFDRATEIAKENKTKTLESIHLFYAIFEEPGQYIENALKSMGAGVDDLRDTLHSIEINQEKSFPIKEQNKTYFLNRFGIDLTELARRGEIEPLIGKRKELLKVIRTLTRRIKNNPLLIGEAGVGKTTIIKGLAQRIVDKNITPALMKKRVVELNIGTLIAGTKHHGEFEERLTGILHEVKTHPDIILFIDEFHTIVGAGKSGGSLDAANIIKPALSSGEMRCIGATTITEYRKYIEKDEALERRFQPVVVAEPTEEETLEILEGLRQKYEKHHLVTISTDALRAAVRLSVRYITDRHLPDKALDVIDEACTRVKVSSVSYIGNLKDISSPNPQVTEHIIAKVIADWTGKPVESMESAELDKFAHIEEELKKRIIGQDDAVEKVSRTVKIGRAGLRDPKKPLGVFLFMGPTGVGKTELAKALAQFLFGSENEMIRLDMSEFMEKHSVSKLTGSPPGYVGYEEEGQLTGKLRTRPYTVVLLDEVEKAHPSVLDVFLQVFDEGRLTDAKGKTVDAKNAIFIMTSNIGVKDIRKSPIGFNLGISNKDVPKPRSLLQGKFRTEFLNRIDEIISFRNLEPAAVGRITALILDKLKERLTSQNISLDVTEETIQYIALEGYDPEFGARPLAREIEQLITIPLTEKLLKGAIKPGSIVIIGMERGKIVMNIS